MVATPPAEHATAATPEDISGLYAHFIVGPRLQTNRSPDLVRNNPAAARQVLGSLRSADLELVHTAVRTAAEAWPVWRNTPAPTRGRVLLEVARLMDTHREDLARLISLEEGKPIRDARAEVQRSINITEFMSGEGRRYGGYTSASESVSKLAFTTRQPLGVVACITPWNFPLAIPAWKIAPALIAGNAVILKPASATPASAVRLAELFQQAGLPDGVLNVLAARGGPAAEVLLDAEQVRAVSLTASTSRRAVRRGVCQSRPSSAARTRPSCWPTPTSTWRPRGSSTARSARPASAARRPAAPSSSNPLPTDSSRSEEHTSEL